MEVDKNQNMWQRLLLRACAEDESTWLIWLLLKLPCVHINGVHNNCTNAYCNSLETCQPTPLHIVLCRKEGVVRRRIMQYLLSKGAKPNLTRCCMPSPLVLAAQNCDTEALQLMLATGCDVNERMRSSAGDNGTVLHECIYHANYHLLTPLGSAKFFHTLYLLDEAGADLSLRFRSPYGYMCSPLLSAVEMENLQLATYLIAGNCDLQDEPLSGGVVNEHRPLRVAIKLANIHMVQLLLKAGSRVGQTDADLSKVTDPTGSLYALLAPHTENLK